VHVSTQRPIIRRIPYTKRGAQFQLSSVTCFVQVCQVEQTIAADTLEHTFVIPLAAYDVTHYWYLTGTQGGVPLESMSQIFWHECTAPILPPVTAKFYSDPRHLFTTVDGVAYRQGTNLTWADIRGGVGTHRQYLEISYYVWLSAGSSSNKWAQLTRHKATFNLASIPPGSLIQAVSYYFYVNQKSCGFVTTPTFALYIPAAPPWNDVLTSDYQNMLNTPISNVLSYNAIVGSAFNHLDILPAFLYLFVPGQLARLGTRIENWDANNTPPAWLNGRNAFLGVWAVDYTAPAQRPYLQVTYQPM
jgi:hypothetical protein